MSGFDRRQFGLGLAGAAFAGRARAQGTTTQGSPARGGTLTLAVAAEPPALTSLTTTAATSVIVSPKVTEGLLTYDFDLTPRPQLAAAWSVSPDGLRYTFTLRQGVTWHDGQQFTSDDVAFSIMSLRQVHPRGQSTFQPLDRVETPDPHTAVLVLARPAPYLLHALVASEAPMLPRHAYAAYGADLSRSPNETAPIGTGPFVFKEWSRGNYLIYERNPAYWDPDKPYLDRLVVRFITDAAGRSVALETGEADLAGWTPVPLSDVKRLGANPALVIDTHGNEYQNNQFYRIEFNTQSKAFADMRVRQAVAHALDRRAILNVVFYGYGAVANGPISPNLKAFYDPATPDLAHDPAKAEALLDAAGLPRGSDGVRLRVTQDANDPNAIQICQVTRDALRRVGIEVTVRASDLSSYVRRIYTTREFEFNAQGSTQMFDPTVGTQRFYWSKNFRPGVPYSNAAAYTNPEVDRALEEGAVEVDPARRRALFDTFQHIVATEAPAVGLVAQSQLTISNKRVRDHTVGADGVSANFADTYLVPA